MWTINDFPAYAMLFEWGTKGKLVCPYCMGDTKTFTLKHEGKSSRFDFHGRFLSSNHPFKRGQGRFLKNRVEMDGPPYVLNENEVWEILHDFPKVTDGPYFGICHFRRTKLF